MKSEERGQVSIEFILVVGSNSYNDPCRDTLYTEKC